MLEMHRSFGGWGFFFFLITNRVNNDSVCFFLEI